MLSSLSVVRLQSLLHPVDHWGRCRLRKEKSVGMSPIVSIVVQSRQSIGTMTRAFSDTRLVDLVSVPTPLRHEAALLVERLFANMEMGK